MDLRVRVERTTGGAGPSIESLTYIAIRVGSATTAPRCSRTWTRPGRYSAVSLLGRPGSPVLLARGPDFPASRRADLSAVVVRGRHRKHRGCAAALPEDTIPWSRPGFLARNPSRRRPGTVGLSRR